MSSPADASSAPPERLPIHLDVVARTHVGLIRQHNEDFFLIGDVAADTMWEPPDADGPHSLEVGARGPLLVVCDGLGGAAAGEVASKLAAEIIWDEMSAAQQTSDRSVYARILRRAVRVANRRVWEAGRRTPERRGMGTTVSAAVVVDDVLLLAQVGDSRAYIARGSSLVQVTRDQSVVSALVRAGRLKQEDARHVPGSNVILQALGIRKDVEVALSMVELRRYDRLLLCSDGVHGPLIDKDVHNILEDSDDLEHTIEQLLEAVLNAGAPDNATLILARFSGEGLAPVKSRSRPDASDSDASDSDASDSDASDSDADMPQFAELDPMEEGERALFDTSVIVRRLAARVGIGEDPGPPVVPATAQFTALRRQTTSQSTSTDEPDEDDGPADQALSEKSRLTLGIIIGIVVAVLLTIALISTLL